MVADTLVASMGLEKVVQVLDLPFDIPPLDVTLQWHERISKDPAQSWLHKAVIEVAENLEQNSIAPSPTGKLKPALVLVSGAKT